MRRRPSAALAALLLAVAGAAGLPARSANAAQPASASVGSGLLSFGGPVTVSRLRSGGANSTAEVLAVTVVDGTGTTSGWTLSATARSDRMQTGAAELPGASARTCAPGSTCTTPDGAVVSYPSTLPMAPLAPTSTVVVRAAAQTGMGAVATSSWFGLLGPGWDDPLSGSTTWIVTLSSAP